jgi:hypothetical protein
MDVFRDLRPNGQCALALSCSWRSLLPRLSPPHHPSRHACDSALGWSFSRHRRNCIWCPARPYSPLKSTVRLCLTIYSGRLLSGSPRAGHSRQSRITSSFASSRSQLSLHSVTMALLLPTNRVVANASTSRPRLAAPRPAQRLVVRAQAAKPTPSRGVSPNAAATAAEAATAPVTTNGNGMPTKAAASAKVQVSATIRDAAYPLVSSIPLVCLCCPLGYMCIYRGSHVC